MVKFCDWASRVVKEELLRTKSEGGRVRRGQQRRSRRATSPSTTHSCQRTENVVVALGEELAAFS